jgi:hypothetical protein
MNRHSKLETTDLSANRMATTNKCYNNGGFWNIFEVSLPAQSFPDKSGQAVFVDS